MEQSGAFLYAVGMQVHFLGGADEVGASCVLVSTAAGHRVLVDAGVRMGASQRDRLPDLARATELGGLDAVLVTHAHLDHSGALPLVHGAFPAAPVWMTEPTLGLLRILLLDALRVMQSKSEREGEIPLYPLPAVEALLARSRTARMLEPVPLCGGALRATFFPAGHVLGAAAVGLECAEGRVLITGDISIDDQLTVPGMARPRFAPDLVVCESTYGGRLHASRRAEEQRLADRVLSVVRDGGKVLVPAFALGRAQEVLLILRRALARADTPPVTVHADGMVRAVCGVYSQYADYLSPLLRNRSGEGRGLFFTGDGRVRAVASPHERQQILAGEACVIVSSSGMLSGGPSTSYAAGLAGCADAMIAITGYQDEEAPGRHLQEVARGQRSELALDGRMVPVSCQVETYTLSAHADAQQICGLVQALGPRQVALVHGDTGAREALAQNLFDAGCRRVHLPAAGDSIEVAAGPRRRGKPVAGVGGDRPLDLARLHRHLWCGNQPRGRTYSANDLARRWYGSEGAPAELEAVFRLLRSDQSLFVADRKRPFLWRCADPAAPAPRAAPAQPAGPPRDAEGRLEQNVALTLVDAALGADHGLYRRGADREGWTLRLFFRFPDVAQQQHAAALEQLAQQSGWQVMVHPEAHQASLEQLAGETLEDLATPCRAPSIHRDLRQVRVVVDRLPAGQQLEAAAASFLEQTGFSLKLEPGKAHPTAARRTYDASGRMEINAAFIEVDRAFAEQPHRPHKKSKKVGADGVHVELSFISPEVGARYQELLDELQYRTSWPMRVATRVDQQAVLAAARALVPGSWQQTKNPGLDVAGRRLLLRLAQPPPEDERAEVDRQLQEKTGFTLG